MNLKDTTVDKKIKRIPGLPRRKFFYYIGTSVLITVVLSKFPFNLFKRKSESTVHSSIKVTENPFAVKRTRPPGLQGKGPVNG